jgi:glyoxylase-like metal-dependent hydrolase (beta-lactamase superfamily II)
MHRIFPNLYRFDFGPRGKDNHMSHSYLLVRKTGNLLVCHCNRGMGVLDYADEIDKLGGIDAQFVPHFHDAKRGDLHQMLYDRFGCEICYHEEERRSIRTKTKCPEREYGDEGLKLGSDFEAHYFPGHTPGMSVFTWKHRGKRFLFPSHVVGLDEDEWRVSFAPHMFPKQKPRFMELAKMDVDYWVRGGSTEGKKEYHALSTTEKKALRKTLRDQC